MQSGAILNIIFFMKYLVGAAKGQSVTWRICYLAELLHFGLHTTNTNRGIKPFFDQRDADNATFTMVTI